MSLLFLLVYLQIESTVTEQKLEKQVTGALKLHNLGCIFAQKGGGAKL